MCPYRSDLVAITLRQGALMERLSTNKKPCRLLLLQLYHSSTCLDETKTEKLKCKPKKWKFFHSALEENITRTEVESPPWL
jgi:hypothetical protein